MRKINKFFSFLIALCLSLSFLLPTTSALVAGAGLNSVNPTGICVSYYDGVDSRGFAWQTSTLVEDSMLIVAKGKGANADWANAVTVNGSYVDFNDFRCHKAHISDLEAGDYSYKVGSNGAFSDIGTFTVDLEKDGKVRFVYVTDSQETSVEGFEQWNKTLTTATQLASPDFIAFAGDLVDNSHAGWGSDMSKVKMEEWSYAFDVPKQVIMNYPFMTVAGNHESAGYTFVNHTNIKFEKEASTGGYYSFVYDNILFIGLDTNAIYDDNAFNAQLAWLEEVLKTSTAQWKILMLHMGAYSTGDHSNDSESIKIRNLIPPICAKYEVDLVLQGHDHVYSRTYPYYYGENENGRIPNRTAPVVQEDGIAWSIEPDGTYYATINYAGTKSYPPVEYDTGRIFPAVSPVNGKVTSQHVQNRMFADVQVDNNTLIFNAYIAKEDGSCELYDYFAVRKNTYEETASLIDALPSTVTPRDSVQLKQAKDSFDSLTERALLRLGADRQAKLQGLLSTFDLESGLNAYEVIRVVDLLDINNLDQTFWANYATAKNLYYSLTEAEKELVVNKESLLSLEDTIAQAFLVERVQQMINGLASSKNYEEDRVVALQAYNLLTEEAKAQITGADKLYQEAPQGGCGGTLIIAGSSLLVALLAAAVTYFILKKKGGLKNEKQKNLNSCFNLHFMFILLWNA